MSELEAGRELDALVAEKVMGLRLPSYDECVVEAEKVWKEQPRCMHFLDGFSAWRDADGSVVVERHCARYSTDIAAAWKVVERLGSMGLYVSISRPPDMIGDAWDVRGWEPITNDRRYIAHAATAPLAICRAALKAVGS